MRWIPLGLDARYVRTWVDGTVVYNVLSGETHVLGPFAGVALREISTAAITADAIHSRLISEFPENEPGQLREELDVLLTEMARLGVVALEFE